MNVSDVCDKATRLDAINHPNVLVILVLNGGMLKRHGKKLLNKTRKMSTFILVKINSGKNS